MRFIGNKTKLLDNIYNILDKYDVRSGDHFFDFFAGTASVGKFFKEKGFVVASSDILYFSYVLQRAYLSNTGEPKFNNVLKLIPVTVTGKLFNSNYESILDHLNSLEGKHGFIFANYTEEGTKGSGHVRKFFKSENGKKIDAIRQEIEKWRTTKLISEEEYFVLLATLIESVPYYANISGVYAAFLKSYDPRSLKDLVLRPIDLSGRGPKGEAFNVNSMDMVKKVNTDILYIDPPYNARQYAPNYHLLETIARYDTPQIKGVAGIRPYVDQKSEFCNTDTALKALDRIASLAQYRILALSYSTEGIMPQKKITEVLSKYGNLQVHEVDYRRYKSNSSGNKHKTPVKEQVYVLKKS